ncbi:NAD(P)/FAD-dependent oxidoreductase [Aspergillus aculeatinus CBS 121060]|uniref:DAO-domain-containing protein n=1 Tax=Aspergillus aculeatinus CBS 121060 TaxID=1448322 RepID=A0ACD1H3Z0_9EURO|nr:DAO-domain-containing protein [Aspergillus aculeatinus CBS 121060]RAH68336.1 DAO-domain-containing protein [Aspergillus aculeatinus CBS 121060]
MALVEGISREVVDAIHEAVTRDPKLPSADPTVSAWQLPPHPTIAKIQSSTLPQVTDYVVIGSGITGCSVTQGILDMDRQAHVTVLEARTFVSGATGRNGGQLVSPVGRTFTEMVERHGKENAIQMTQFSLMNAQQLRELVRDADPQLKTESEMRDVRKIMAVTDRESWQKAETSLDAFCEAFPSQKTYHRVIFKKHNVKGAIGGFDHEAAALSPYRLFTGIFQRLLEAHADRLSLEANTPVIAIDHEEPAEHSSEISKAYPYIVSTPRGRIRARHVVHCTNAFAAHLLPALRGHVYPFRGTMSVQSMGARFENKGDRFSWSSIEQTSLDATSNLYRSGLMYLQQHARTGHIWVGTETANILDVLTADDSKISSDARQYLQSFLPTYFEQPAVSQPELKEIWTGIQGHTSDCLPLVGLLPECLTARKGTGEWICGAYNGYGMDKAWLSGKALVELIMGREAPTWFPRCFLINEARFLHQMNTKHILERFKQLAQNAPQTTAKASL